MSTRIGMVASLTCNVVLAALALYFFMRSPEADPAIPEYTRASAPEAPRSRDVELDAEKILALAELEAAENKQSPDRPEFWKPDVDQQIRRQAEAIEVRRGQIREALISRFGADAVEAPVFSRIFKPLNSRYPYLSSKSQIGLLKLLQARPPATRSAPDFQRPLLTASEPSAGFIQRQAEFEEAVRTLLTPQEFIEYQLRESPLARQLRSSNITRNEQEFRATFGVLLANSQQRTAANYVAEQQQLKSMLGAERYLLLAAARDPSFAAIQSAGARHRLSAQQIRQAYSVFLEAHNELAMLSLDPEARDRGSPDRPTQGIIARRDAEVARLVGDAAASDLIRDYMDQMMSVEPRNQASAIRRQFRE